MHCDLLGVANKLFKMYLNSNNAIKPRYKLIQVKIQMINERTILFQYGIPNILVRSLVNLMNLIALKLQN